MTVWETDVIPPSWSSALNMVDSVVVPNAYNVRVFRECRVVRPIHVIPHPVVPLLPSPHVGDDALRCHGAQRYYCFYTINEFNNRKNIAAAIDAYMREFSSRDDTLFYIKTNDKDLTSAEMDQLVDRLAAAAGLGSNPADRPRLHIDCRYLPENTIPMIHGMGDCFVSTARSEGVGLGVVQAALLGKHVVYVPFGGVEHYFGADGDAARDDGIVALPYTMVPARFCPPGSARHAQMPPQPRGCRHNPVYDSDTINYVESLSVLPLLK